MIRDYCKKIEDMTTKICVDLQYSVFDLLMDLHTII